MKILDIKEAIGYYNEGIEKKTCLLGEVTVQRHAAAQKCLKTPMG